MSYALETGESVAKGIKRIAHEQVDKALDELTTTANEPEADRNEAVHDARKRFKKIRALVRLVRDEIGEDVYQHENRAYRDAGRLLAAVRDSYVMVETVDDLLEHFADQVNGAEFVPLREALLVRHQAAKQRVLDDEEKLSEAIARVKAARSRIDDWPIDEDDFDAIEDGLKRVYKRGYKGMANAYDKGTPTAFHEWRKRVKYLWYHIRILAPLWPTLFAELADEVHQLANYLGDHHDLAVLHKRLQEHPMEGVEQDTVDAVIGLSKQRRTQLEAKAKPLGARIYVEKPKVFIERMDAYWSAYEETTTD